MRRMMMHSELPPLDPTIIAPGFLNPVCNAIANADLDYLRRQLRKHHVVTHDLPGAEMYDAHGFRLHVTRSLQAEKDHFPDASAVIPDFHRLFAACAARRVALIVTDADRLTESDAQRTLQLIETVARDADRLRNESPPTQLLLFLAGPAPAYRSVEPSAQRRADAQRGPRALESDFNAKPWTSPAEFDLRAHHQLTISHAAWYYASLGRRAEKPEDRWHCVESNDTLTFYRASDGVPCIAGTFAKMQKGMQLVGIRYESNIDIYRIPWDGEDPFTLFRRLCEEIAIV